MNKPGITRDRALALIAKHGLDLEKEKVILIGVRGYFLNTMGRRGQNDYGIFDDAFIWLDLEKCYTYNGNTDPSRQYHRVATLKAGIWTYLKGIHPLSRPGGYPAFRQAEEVTVERYGAKDDTGWFGINIHKGGVNNTSSAGCQTLVAGLWDAFKDWGYGRLDKYQKKTFKYLLVENDGSIA